MIYDKNEMGIKERAELEAARMRVTKQEALLDYVAMMTDVELPEEGEEEQEVDE